MRRFLVCGGVHGRLESLEWLNEAVRQRRPEGILFAGGVLDRQRRYEPTSSTCWGHTPECTHFLQRFFSTLGETGVFTAIIPGVQDAPLDVFLRLGMNAEAEYPRLRLVHVTPVEEADVAVVGLGAAITDYTSGDIGYYSRSLADYYLRSLWTTTKPRTVLLLPAPPQSWRGEEENRRLANALVATYRPDVCVLGNPVGKRGADRVGVTLMINPGHLSDGYAAWFDWDRPAGEQVELLDLLDRATSCQPLALGHAEDCLQRAGQAAGV